MAQNSWLLPQASTGTRSLEDIDREFPPLNAGGETAAAGQGEAPAGSAEVAGAPPMARREAYVPATGNKTDEELAKESWGQYLGETAQNIPGSAKHIAGGMLTALSDPGALVQGLGQLGTGAISKAKGYLGAAQTPQEKAQDEAALDAVVQSYKDQYGDWNKIRRTVHDNPVAPALDVASIAPGIGTAGKILGLGEKAGVVAKGLSLLDPAQAAFASTKIPMYVAKGALARTSGVDSSILDVIQNAGRTGTRDQLQAMARHANKSADPMEQVNTAIAATNELKKNVSDSFVNNMQSLQTKNLNVDPALKAIDDARAHVGTYVDPVSGQVKSLSPETEKTLDAMEAMLRGSIDTSAVNLHKIKVAMGDLLGAHNGSPYLGSLGNVPGALRDIIGVENPQYLKAMDDYSNWLRELNDLKNIGAAGNRGSTANKIAKMMKAMKDKRGQSLIAKLATTNSGKNLPYMLAGSAMSNWLPKWATGMQDMLGYSLLGGAGGLAGMFTPHALAGLAAASPRAVGTAMKYIGKAQRLGDKAGIVVNPTTRAAISHMNEAGLPMPEPVEGSEQAAGGRIGRKTGGRVGNPASEADRLIAAAEKAKKNQGAKTEALLQVPDEAITKALAVANENI